MGEPNPSSAGSLTLAEEVDSLCDRYEAALRRGETPTLEDWLPPAGPARATALGELVRLELEHRLRNGEPANAADYLARFPELAADATAVERLQAAEKAIRGRPDVTATLGDSAASGAPQCAPTVVQVPGYEILGELGRGGMGVVYRARHIGLNRVVALKMLLSAQHAGDAERKRFRSEAEALARLQHPHIVQIFEVGEHDHRPFLALEFCPGGGLDKKLAGAPLPPKAAAALVETLARAVHAAHEANVVHRDLKPANVLLAADGTPKITDFGLAKRLDESGQTRSGAVVGTPSYMAPEQARGQKEVGPPADIYALGAILYECLTGRPPFKGPSALDTIVQVMETEPAPPRRLQPRTPADLETVCLKCLEKQPSQRYGTALEAAEDLRRFRVGELVRARRVGGLTRALKWARRRPALAAVYGLLLAALVLGIGGGGATWLWLRAENARADLNGALRRAETAEGAAEKARDDLTGALRREQDAKRQLTQYAYADKVYLAQQEWDAGRTARAWGLLAEAGDLQEKLTPGRRPWEWDYLNRAFHPEIAVLQGHTGGVARVAFSPDGRRLATASDDFTARLWDADSGKPLAVLRGHRSDVNTLSFSRQGDRILTTSFDNTAEVWDAETGLPIAILQGHRGAVWAAAFSPDGSRTATASADGTARLWDAASGRTLAVLRGHTKDVWSVAFDPNGKRVATASADGTARLWDAKTGDQLASLEGGNAGKLTILAWSPDGGRIAAAGENGAALLWDAASGRQVAVLRGHAGGLNAVAFSPDGRRLVTAGIDKTARVWDAEIGTPIAVLQGHTKSVEAATFSPDGDTIATASDDSTARLWNADSGQQLAILQGHTGWVNSVAFRPDGERLATASSDQTARLWDVVSESPVALLRGHIRPVESVCFSPDGDRLATASHDGTARLWDGRTGKPLAAWDAQAGALYSVCYSPDGRLLATAGHDGPPRLWDAASGKLLAVLQGPTGIVVSVAFSPDGSRIAAASDDGTARLWDATTGEQRVILRGHEKRLHAIAFSPDGRRVATVSSDRTARLWDAETGKQLAVLKGHTNSVYALAFSPDGARIATGGMDQTARLWDAATGQPLAVLEGHANTVYCVTFSPDGARIATASDDMTVRLWDVASGKQLIVLRGHTNMVHAVAFSPDGSRLASSGWDGTARLWIARESQQDETTRRQEQHRAWRAEQADAAEQAGRWFAAAFHLSRLIEADPADASLYLRRCRTQIMQGRVDRAASDLLMAAAVIRRAGD